MPKLFGPQNETPLSGKKFGPHKRRAPRTGIPAPHRTALSHYGKTLWAGPYGGYFYYGQGNKKIYLSKNTVDKHNYYDEEAGRRYMGRLNRKKARG